MRLPYRMLLGVGIALLAIQLIPPARPDSGQAVTRDIAQVYGMPENVRVLFKNACYDCHSDNTRYPWYFRVQPLGWWLTSHIEDAKAELNLSAFGAYSPRRRQSKLRGMVNSLQDGTMPLQSYTLLHPAARLSDAEKAEMIRWIRKAKASSGTSQEQP
ncbi:heme-binding domain-containing protein [Pontibacter chitinilyticus]|uniref:heme-binding domain-containing protein n=1 Tax=Pontibacter chitinilyticus TaxID=2674989 RepID=UPI00321BCC2A